MAYSVQVLFTADEIAKLRKKGDPAEVVYKATMAALKPKPRKKSPSK